MKIFYWDFFGPDSEQTAKHFVRHLDESLVENGITGCTTGLESRGEGHHAVVCRAAPQWHSAIENTFKPKRTEEEPG